MSKIEFKYEPTEDNTIRQLSGELRGLKPLNRSNLIATLPTSKMLKIEVNRLDPLFFTAGQTSNGHNETTREAAFDKLVETFGQVSIWAKINDDDGNETKVIIRPTAKVVRDLPDTKLVIVMPVEIPDE